MIKKTIVFELPVTSSEFTSDVVFTHFQGNAMIAFHYLDRDEKNKECHITMNQVYKCIFSTDVCCDAWKIEHAYEQMIRLEHSEWIEEIYGLSKVQEIPIQNNLKHFMLYIPDFGCYEFVAECFSKKIIDH